ncbi:MAG: hypothetical protein KGZ68_16925 [Dechloromonas sp.]|nr:hypothetical protein [Dechloromonas sp.]
MSINEIAERLRTDFSAGQKLKDLYRTMQAARRSGRVKLADDIAWLEPLMDAFLDDMPGFRRFLLDLCIRKGQYRVPMEGEGDHKTLRDLYRLVYQNTTMTERRGRLYKAIEIYRRRGYSFTNVTRALTASRQVKHWAEQRSAYLEKVKKEYGGKLSWDDRNAAIEKFWHAVDTKLDAELESLK